MAESKYSSFDHVALVAEIKARRANGQKIPVDLRAENDKLIGALEADDAATKETPAADITLPPAGATELTPQILSAGAEARADGVVAREIPADLNEYSGQYVYLREGEFKGTVFGLKVLPADQVRANKTHQAKSPRGFWDGTAEEFRAQFDRL